MNGLTDSELLVEYTQHRAEAAFGELVRRHIDLVYSAALRMVRDAHLAQDVSQGVFVALAQNARNLTDCRILSGWLHRTTLNIAANTVRSEVRRRAREHEAAVMSELSCAEPQVTWEELAPHLDAALGELSDSDRDSLLLRYFERKSAREIALRLGTTEEAAQKRVGRATDRLRELLARRGVVAGAGSLAVIISANAVQAAPAASVVTITASAALAGTTLGTFATAATKSVVMTTLQKTVITAALAAAIGWGTYETRQASRLRSQVETLQQQTASRPNSAPENSASNLQSKVNLLTAQNDALSVELAQANADKGRLKTESEQARRIASLYKELVDQSKSKEINPTNAYPTPRHVWTAFGKLGRLGALSAQDESNLSPEEKAALSEARVKAIDELPNLLKAAKLIADASPTDEEEKAKSLKDAVGCLLYGALNLDEQQFSQLYSVMDNFEKLVKEKGITKQTPQAESAEAIKQMREQFKAQLEPMLTSEQVQIFNDVMTHIQVEPGNWGFNFSFSKL